MKIIKQGKLNKIEKCSYCECEFEYGVKDIKKQFEYSPCSIKLKRKYVECPECGNKIKIKLQGE